jgi:hypothetical protein
MKLKLGNADRVVSISAIIISVSTLVVLIYQTNLMREQQRLSVLPYIMISNQYIGTPDYKLVLKNDGIGPAFVESIKVFYRDSTYEKDFARFMVEDVPQIDSISNIYYSNIGVGQLIPAGIAINVLEIQGSLDDSNKLYALITKMVIEDNLDFEIIYASIYGEQWKLTAKSPKPERIN